MVTASPVCILARITHTIGVPLSSVLAADTVKKIFGSLVLFILKWEPFVGKLRHMQVIRYEVSLGMGKTATGCRKKDVVIKQGRVLHGQMERAYLTCLFESS